MRVDESAPGTVRDIADSTVPNTGAAKVKCVQEIDQSSWMLVEGTCEPCETTQSDDPEGECYAVIEPAQCLTTDYTWIQGSRVCGPDRAYSSPIGTARSLSDATLPTTGSMTLTCESDPDGGAFWVNSEAACTAEGDTCPAEQFTWSSTWSGTTHECGPAQSAEATHLNTEVVIDDNRPTTGSLELLCLAEPGSTAQWVQQNPQCNEFDPATTCEITSVTWFDNGVACGPQRNDMAKAEPRILRGNRCVGAPLAKTRSQGTRGGLDAKPTKQCRHRGDGNGSVQTIGKEKTISTTDLLGHVQNAESLA